MPLRGASGPGETARATTSSPCSDTTANRGTPSPITISERSVTSAANFSKSTTTRSCPASLPGVVNVTTSPTSTGRGSVDADRRSFGPCRSNSSPIARPARCRRGANLGRAPPQIVVIAVRAVQPRAVEPRLDEPVQHAGGVRGRDRASPRSSFAAPASAAVLHRTRHRAPCVGSRGGSLNNTGGRDESGATDARDRRGGGGAGVHGAGGGADAAHVVDPKLEVGTVATGLNQPVQMELIGDDDFFVLEKATGQVKRVTDGGAPRGRARPDRQLRLRARPARHRARQVLPPQRLRLPVLERDDAAAPTTTPGARCRRWATASTASSGTARR